MYRTFARGALLAIAGVLLSVLVLTTGCASTSPTTSSTSTPTNTSTSQGVTPTATTTTTTQTVTIGQTVTVAQVWQLTAVNFRLFTPPNRTPTAGMKFVALEVNVKNISNSDQGLTAADSFIIRDATGQQYQQIYVGGISLALNDVLSPGDTEHGVVAFEVPSGTNAYTITFTGSASQPKGEYLYWPVSL